MATAAGSRRTSTYKIALALRLVWYARLPKGWGKKKKKWITSYVFYEVLTNLWPGDGEESIDKFGLMSRPLIPLWTEIWGLSRHSYQDRTVLTSFTPINRAVCTSKYDSMTACMTVQQQGEWNVQEETALLPPLTYGKTPILYYFPLGRKANSYDRV